MTHTDQIRTASGLNALAGIWLAISTWFFRVDVADLGTAGGAVGYDLDVMAGVWNATMVGLIVAVLGASRFFGAFRAAWFSWINAVLGVWLVLSPFLFGYTWNAGRMWNSIIVGAVIAVLGVWSAMATKTAENV